MTKTTRVSAPTLPPVPTKTSPKPPTAAAPLPKRSWSDLRPVGPRGSSRRDEFQQAPRPPVVMRPISDQTSLTDRTSPMLMTNHRDPKAGLALLPTKGPLFAPGGPRASDVNQRSAADCYFMATLASLAESNPDAIKRLITQNSDGTYTVHFKQLDEQGRVREVPVRVDNRLYTARGDSVYGSTAKDGSQPALWVPLVEKAWAKLHDGSYENIGHGGWPSDVMAQVLGRPSASFRTGSTTADETFARLELATGSKWPVCASTTIDPSQAGRYAGSGLEWSHSYSVLGVSERDGQRFVTLRNPYGRGEVGNDGADDGRFELPLSEFMKYFDVLDASPS